MREALEAAPAVRRESAWRTLGAAAGACVAAFALCVVVLTQIAPGAAPPDGAPGLRQPLAR